MSLKVLFLAWQDQKSRLWYPVGRLEANVSESRYIFEYTRGAGEAKSGAGFTVLPDFPEFHQRYESSELFPLFQNRVLSPGRPDFPEYLRQLGLDSSATAPEILAVGGGERATDAFEVFPKLQKNSEGKFCCRFFLHGWRYMNDASRDRIKNLVEGEELSFSLELNNPVTGRAVQLQTKDYYVLGWAPRYLRKDIIASLLQSEENNKGSREQYKVSVVKLNPPPAPSKQRVLLELIGDWPDHEPMSEGMFAPFR